MDACTFIFVGISGGGKGTQVKLLKKFLCDQSQAENVSLLETGKYFRELAESSPDLKTKLNGGNLAPDDMANYAVTVFINEVYCENHVIFDGYPRTLKQAEYFEKVLSEFREKPVIIINYKVSEDTAISRIFERAKTENRGDNNIEAITSRIKYFKTDVEPVINYYKQHNKYHYIEVNGEKTIEESFNGIINFCMIILG